jgi:hypothetical protein
MSSVDCFFHGALYWESSKDMHWGVHSGGACVRIRTGYRSFIFCRVKFKLRLAHFAEGGYEHRASLACSPHRSSGMARFGISQTDGIGPLSQEVSQVLR